MDQKGELQNIWTRNDTIARRIDKSTIIGKDVNTHSSTIDRTIRKINKHVKDSNHTINQLYVIDF